MLFHHGLNILEMDLWEWNLKLINSSMTDGGNNVVDGIKTTDVTDFTKDELYAWLGY